MSGGCGRARVSGDSGATPPVGVMFHFFDRFSIYCGGMNSVPNVVRLSI
jgi:hypothetical protein